MPQPHRHPLARVATALDGHPLVWFPEEVPGKLKDAVQGCATRALRLALDANRPDRHGRGLGQASIMAASSLIRERAPYVVLGGRVRTDNAASLAMVAALGAVLVPDEDADYVVIDRWEIAAA